MFQDLSNSSLTYLNPDRTKASPSVYSENDGSFNSEENLRWATKKIAQKPFIVGKDTAEVNKSFTFSGAPYGAYIGEGLFNIDGYLFKASSNGNVTYDSGLGNASSFVANTQYIQRFISELTHYGTSDELSADYSNFCFSEFLPSSGSFDPVNWENALNSGEPVGFVKTVFRNGNEKDESYRSQLYQNGENLEFICNGVSVSSVPLKYIGSAESYITPDNIRTTVFNGVDPKNYYAVASVISSDTFIVYPVYVKKFGNNEVAITFTDIFTLTYKHSVSEFMTSSYPSTTSNLIGMTGANFDNAPTQCKTTTMPSNRYAYNSMYSGTTRQSVTVMRSSRSALSGVFDILSIDDLTSLIPQNAPFSEVKNDLSYYCLKLTTQEQQSTQLERNGQKIPVALFTSEGSLCTDGFIINNNVTTSMEYSPVESYIHYIRRNYLISTSQTVTEEAIENVTLTDLNGWNGFTPFYNNNIAKAMSAYLNLCYDSLLDNVFFNTDANDFMNIKVLGCGEHYGSGVNDDFAKIATVTADGHKLSGGQWGDSTFETSVRFEKDITSDKYKVCNHVNTASKTALIPGKLFYNEPVVETFTWTNSGTNVYRFEDPRLFLTNCIDSGAKGLESFTLYYDDSADNTSISGDGKIALDEFLVPIRKKTSDATQFNMYGPLSVLRTQENIKASLVNSACYRFYKNTWQIMFPTTISVNKDNLNYLRGRDYDVSSKYDGITLNYCLPCEVSDDVLYMFDLGLTSMRSKQGYDVEQAIKYRFIDSEYIRVRREAFIHVNKLYGDGYKGFRECVEEITENMIEEASGGYDLSVIPLVKDALKDHIKSSQRNIFYVSDDYISEEFFKTDDDSNVSFKIHRSPVYADSIGIHIDVVDGVRSAVKDTYLDIEFRLFEHHTDLCLIGSPNESSETGLRAELYKKESGGTLTYLISDFGGWDFDQRDVQHTNNFSPSQTFVYRVVVPAGTEQDSDDWFSPQVFEFSEFNIGLFDVIKYVGTAGSVYNDIQTIKNTDTVLTNRPSKNNLSIYSGTGLGKIRIDCIVPIKLTDFVLSFESLYAENQSQVSQPNVSFDVYSDDNVRLISDAHITCGDNVSILINKSSVLEENQNKNIGYIIIDNHEVHPLNPEITTTFSGAMLCTKSDWDISTDFVRGYGDIYETCKRLPTVDQAVISLVNRPYKNLLKLNDRYFIPTLDDPELTVDLEYPADWNYDYVLYVHSTDVDLHFKVVDINDAEYGPYVIEGSPTVDTAFDLQSVQNKYIKSIVVWTDDNATTDIRNMMLCRKSDWDVSNDFVYSVSALNDMI